MKEPIFLTPVLQTKLWGGTKLHDVFGLTLPNDTIGEAWCISAHPGGISTVIAPAQYQGMGLDELYRQHIELFGTEQKEVFPLLVKILDASDDLSVQVHPDDAYGLSNEGELGKTECWYVIAAEEGASIVYGHNALTREQFAEMVDKHEWSDLLTEVPVKAGDFFYVPHGTVHAIGKGIMILETQQNSDTTYRVYDYDRTDEAGNERPLHIQRSLDVTMFPHKTPNLDIRVNHYSGGKVTDYVSNEYFTVSKWESQTELVLPLTKPYTLATVIEGNGVMTIEGVDYALNAADSFILPTEVREVHLKGPLTLITSSE